MCAKIDKKLESDNIYTLLDMYKPFFSAEIVMHAFQSGDS